MKTIAILAAVLTMLLSGPAGAQQLKVDNLPPSVISTVPQAGLTDVDPNLSEIRVTFSKPMMTKEMWSWVIHTKETFPRITGPVRYLPDGRTCVAPVKLEPGRTYAVWFNAGKYNAFRDTGNRPAVPYLLVFETRR